MDARRISRIGWVPFLVVAAVVAAGSVASGAGLGALSRGGSQGVVSGAAALPGEGRLAALPPNQAAGEVRSANGFSVELQPSATPATDSLVFYYRVSVQGEGGFGEMLGIPRVFNPDGSVALPMEYGAVGAAAEAAGSVRGLGQGSSGAIFQQGAAQPGAILRFGPFFRSSAQGFALDIPVSGLRAGFPVTIDGERFLVTVAEREGAFSLQFVNQETGGEVVATHPGSQATVLADGRPLTQLRGSTNFAKTAGYDVNANRSAVEVQGSLDGVTEVTVVNDSTGRVYRGNWDFPLP